MALQVVLVEPLIPQNTGTIARLTAATGVHLHLVEPLGFELTDKYLKRAGLDYWPEVKLSVHKNWADCLANLWLDGQQRKLWFLTTHAERSYTDACYGEDDVLVFGNEERGLAEAFHSEFADSRLTIPMDNPRIRSLNLSNAVSIVVFEARRQLGLLARPASS